MKVICSQSQSVIQNSCGKNYDFLYGTRINRVYNFYNFYSITGAHFTMLFQSPSNLIIKHNNHIIVSLASLGTCIKISFNFMTYSANNKILQGHSFVLSIKQVLQVWNQVLGLVWIILTKFSIIYPILQFDIDRISLTY